MRIKILILLLVLLTIFSCTHQKEIKSFTILTWNMYAFFDSTENGYEFDGFKEKDGYDGEKYKNRIEKTARVIIENFNSPDILILEEVESIEVLRDLQNAGLNKKGYNYYGLAEGDNDGLYVAFISKYNPISLSVHGVDNVRPILELTFLLEGEEIVVFGLHGPSQLKEENDTLRFETFSLLRSLIREKEGSAVISLGDYNSYVGNKDNLMVKVVNAGNKEIPLLITGDGFEAKGNVLYSPFYDNEKETEGGTYFYEGEWNYLDNILMNNRFFDGRGWEYKGCKVMNDTLLTDYMGRPKKYDSKTEKGYSDHFAIMAYFEYD